MYLNVLHQQNWSWTIQPSETLGWVCGIHHLGGQPTVRWTTWNSTDTKKRNSHMVTTLTHTWSQLWRTHGHNPDTLGHNSDTQSQLWHTHDHNSDTHMVTTLTHIVTTLTHIGHNSDTHIVTAMTLTWSHHGHSHGHSNDTHMVTAQTLTWS